MEKKKKFVVAGMLVLLLAAPVITVYASGQGGRDSAGKVHPMRFVVPGFDPQDYQKGIDAVNAKLKADGVDIEVSVIRIPWAQYDQKVNLMLSAGEPFELIHVMNDVKNITSLTSRDALLPLDDMLKKYPNLVAKFNQHQWRAGLVNGKTYAVPAYWRSFDYYLGYLTVRTDLLEKMGIKEFPRRNVDEVLNVMKRIQDYLKKEIEEVAYHYPHNLAWAPNWLHRTYDTYPFYVENSLGLVLSRQNGTLDSYYESEEFKKDAAVYRRMFQMGFIHPDILSQPPEAKSFEYAQGAMLPGENQMYTSVLQQTFPEAREQNMWLAEEKPNMVFTLGQNMNAISATAEDPESGLKFLNWLYASRENFNLWHMGIEGVHWTRDEEYVKLTTDEYGNLLYWFDTWMTGYVPYYSFARGTDQAVIDMWTKEAPNRVYSPMAGFIFDATPVASELASLQTEIIASFYPLKYGLVDWDATYPRALSRLKSAGLDKYLAEYRRQFAEYLKAHPDALEL